MFPIVSDVASSGWAAQKDHDVLMLVGHTKFSPDWCFGLLKQRFRHTFVSSLQDLADVITQSADVNEVQFVGT